MENPGFNELKVIEAHEFLRAIANCGEICKRVQLG